MKTSRRGVEMIKKFEGCRLEAYKDAVGVLTIGYGHTGSDVKPDLKITEETATKLLKKDLQESETLVNLLILNGYKLNQNEYDALVSFTFNLGGGNLQKLTKHGKRNKGAIADAIPLYNKAGGKVLSGLVKRRKMEKELFLTPVC